MIFITHLSKLNYDLINEIFMIKNHEINCKITNYNDIINKSTYVDKNEKYIFITEHNINTFNNYDNVTIVNINVDITVNNIVHILIHLNYNFDSYYQEYNNSIISNEKFTVDKHYEYIKNPWKILNENKKFPVYQRYSDSINSENADKNIKITNNMAIEYDNSDRIALLISNGYSFNFHCQVTELFPMLIICKMIINKYDIKYIDIFISKIYEKIYTELFEIFDIKNINIKYLDICSENMEYINIKYKKIYNFGWFNGHRKTNHYTLDIFTLYLKYYFNNKYINNEHNVNNHENVALLRINNSDKDEINKNANFITQPHRYIYNSNEIKIFLENKNFNVINTENMSLYERFIHLSYKKNIIIEAGASMPNLYFCKNNEQCNVILLCNENMYNYHGIYEDQIKYYYNNVNVIVGSMENDIMEKSNEFVNYPYIININELDNNIKN